MMDPLPSDEAAAATLGRGFAAARVARALAWVRAALVVLGLVAWGSAGVAPLRDALAGASAPSDFATDFVPAVRIARGERGSVDVATGNRLGATLGAPPYADVGTPFAAHPPPAVALVRILVPLGFRGAALAWLALSLAGLAAVAGAIATTRAARPRAAIGAAGPRRAVTIFAVLCLWPPVLHNLEKGQWSLLVAGLLAGAWYLSLRGRDAAAGALVAVAGCFKLTPFLVLPALLLGARPRRVAGGAAVTTALVVSAAAIVVGPGAFVTFGRNVAPNTRGWQTAPANTLSLWGALARLLVGGSYARPLTSAAAAALLARGLWALGAAGLIAWTLWSLRRASLLQAPVDVTPKGPRPLSLRARAFVAASILAVVLNPLAWSHTASWLLLPAACVADTRTRIALGLAFIGLTVPRAALLAVAGPLPVPAGRGLVLGLHLVAALTLLALALRRARPTPAPS